MEKTINIIGIIFLWLNIISGITSLYFFVFATHKWYSLVIGLINIIVAILLSFAIYKDN